MIIIIIVDLYLSGAALYCVFIPEYEGDHCFVPVSKCSANFTPKPIPGLNGKSVKDFALKYILCAQQNTV